MTVDRDRMIADLKLWRTKDPDTRMALRTVMDRLRVRTLENFADEHPDDFARIHEGLADMHEQDGDVAKYDAALRHHLREQFDRIDDIEAYRIALQLAIDTGIDPLARRELELLEEWVAARDAADQTDPG